MWQFVYLLGYLFVCFVIWGGESETALAWRLFSNCASVRYDILMFCLCASVGQLFIFTVIQEFGSLLWVTISITRKLVTIFVSVIMFNHQISAGQWAGVGLVFAGMGLEVVMNYLAKQKPKKDDDTAENSSPGNKKIN
ncbi:hut1 [Symbiodinium microadriaticum]|nr:hut1 [Symbiodinium microadriaticum]